MSDIKFKLKNHGLRLAHQHRSAVSQAKAAKVYEKIDVAKMRDNSLPSSVRISRGVKAIRMGIDRISRLGERLRENSNVAPADHKLMEEEYKHLKTQLSGIFQREMGHSMAFDKKSDFLLNEAPEQFSRLMDAVYSGGIQLTDRIDSVGQLMDLEADHYLMNFKGKFHLKDAPRPVDVVTGIESLSDSLKTSSERISIPLDGEYSGESYVNNAIERVTGDILSNADRAIRTHIDNRNMANISILFDDALGNK